MMSPMKLEDELRLYGCDLTPQVFENTLANLLAALFPPNVSSEQLLHEPDRAKRYCDAVRRSTGCEELPDEMILRRLQNVRKGWPEA
jgi:hypothetical protein